MKKLFIIISSLILYCETVNAQYKGLAASFTYDNFLGENTGSGKLLGFRLGYEQINERFGLSGSWRTSVHYSFGNFTDQYIANLRKQNGFNPVQLPPTIQLDGITNYKSLKFEFTQKLYFGKGNIQYGGAYFLMGFAISTVKKEIDYLYDSRTYQVIETDKSKSELTHQFNLNMGGGYEFHLEAFNVFIESNFNLPVFALSNIDIEQSSFDETIHKSYGVAIGIRIHLN